MEERVLKTKTALSKMLSIPDETYGVKAHYFSAHILNSFERLLIESGCKEDNRYNADETVYECSRVFRRLEKWQSLIESDLPDYEDAITLAAIFGCEVRDFIFSDYEPLDETDPCFDYFYMWSMRECTNETVELSICVPRIRDAAVGRKPKTVNGGESGIKNVFRLASDALFGKVSKDGLTLLDRVMRYVVAKGNETKTAEIHKSLSNVETALKRRDRVPPAHQVVAYEAITGVSASSIYKEVAEKIICEFDTKELKKMGKGKLNPIETLKASNLIKDRLEVWCDSLGYEVTDGGKNYIIIRKDDKYGLVAVASGERTIIEPKYDYIVKQKDTVCAINGNEIFKVEISEGKTEKFEMSHGARQATQEGALQITLCAIDAALIKGYRYFEGDNGMRVLTPEGKELRCRYTKSRIECAENIIAYEDGKRLYGLTVNSVPIIPPAYEEEILCAESLFLAKKQGKYGFLNYLGIQAIPFIYDDAAPFSEGLAVVCVNGKYGFIGQSGDTAINCQYDFACSFYEGMACVTFGGKDGYIAKSGNIVIAPQYDNAFRFSGGFAAFQRDGKYGYINKQGTEVIPATFDDASSNSGGIITVIDNGVLIKKKIA
ncbi:MAG: WG repeat-containing protein [Firmicutes bacterium]|nr:WG repeat-containing protein [Bacillota bacterium]